MARKLPRLQRVLDAPALASVAYGEVASSIYFALGIVALHALGLTPVVLARRRRSLSRRHAVVRRGNDRDRRDRRRRDLRPCRVQRPRRIPHRLGALPRLPDRDRALGALLPALPRARDRGSVDRRAPGRRDRRLRRHRGDRRRAAARAGRGSTRSSFVVPLLDLVTQLLLVVLGFAFLFSPQRAHARARPRHAAVLAPDRVRPAARLPRVHRPRDRREPRGGDATARPRPAAQPLHRHRRRRRRHGPDRARRPLRVPGRRTGRQSSGRPGSARRSWGSSTRSARTSAYWVERMLRVYVGLTGALILLIAAVTSNSGFGRLALLPGGARPASTPRSGDSAAAACTRPRRSSPPRAISMALLLVDGLHDESRRLPREPLQLRCARRVHRCTARSR